MELVIDFKTHKADIPTIGIIVIGITSSVRVSKVSAAKELWPNCRRLQLLRSLGFRAERSASGLSRPCGAITVD
jgi:hypothetical protein